MAHFASHIRPHSKVSQREANSWGPNARESPNCKSVNLPTGEEGNGRAFSVERATEHLR